MPTFPRLSLDDVQAPPKPIPFRRHERDDSAPPPVDAAEQALRALDRVQSKLDELDELVDESLAPIPFRRHETEDETESDDGPYAA